MRKSDIVTILWFTNGKNQWKTYYFQTEDIEKANALSGFKIYPDAKATNLEKKLNFLKENRLNLYLDYSQKKTPLN